MTILMRTFAGTTLAQMQCVDIGGNPLGDAKTCQLFTEIFTYMRWPQLQSLNLACTWGETQSLASPYSSWLLALLWSLLVSELGESGARELANTFAPCAQMRLQHLDLTGNRISKAMREFTDCLRAKALPALLSLGLGGPLTPGFGYAPAWAFAHMLMVSMQTMHSARWSLSSSPSHSRKDSARCFTHLTSPVSITALTTTN